MSDPACIQPLEDVQSAEIGTGTRVWPCVVVASHHYGPDDYIRSFSELRKSIGSIETHA
jgi:hypothetical protein